MELRRYLRILRRRWVSVAIVVGLCLAAMTTVTFVMTPRYTATTALYFGVQGTGTAADLSLGSTYTEQQMTSYVKVATSPLVLNQVIQDLGLSVSPKQLAEQMSVTVPADTAVLELSVTDVSAEQAARIANAAGTTLAKTAASLVPDRADGTQAVRATTLAAADVPVDPSSPDVERNLAVGLGLGLLLALGVALLRDGLDTKLRSAADVAALTGTAILGVIGFSDDVAEHPVILREDPRGATAESVRRLRTNLQFVDAAERCRSVVVSSSVPGEGKTTTAINLAVALADDGARVLLIDADLRRASVATYLGLESDAGLTTVLIGRADLADVVQPWGDTTLDVLAAGQIPPNPSELLGSTAMRTLISRLTKSYDSVIIDSPPLLPVTDAAVLGRQAGGVLLVAGVDRLHRPQLKEALDSLDTAGAKPLGLVINKIARREISSYAYYERYYSAEESTDLGGHSTRAARTSAGADSDAADADATSTSPVARRGY